MIRFVLFAQWKAFLYFCRAMVAIVILQGIRMPFFNNCITETER